MYNSMTALVIDDTATTRQFVSRVLQSELQFLKVLQASDAREGLARLSEDESVDLIICDWEMPKITGLSFLNRVKEDKRWNSIPFIMATSRSDKTSIVKAIEAGVNDYVIKPFSGQTLEAKIKRLFKGSKTQSAHAIKVVIKSSSVELGGTLVDITEDGCTLKTKSVNNVENAFGEAKIFVSCNKDSFFVKGSFLGKQTIRDSSELILSFLFNDVDNETLSKLNKCIESRKAN